ncbi:MAG: glycosyltransferase [Acidimicrobiia bacterium]|nr:glycosyltransferase [Acidimicrobiia bacterium]
MLTTLPPTTSVGRIWRHGLGELERHVRIRVVDRPGRGRRRSRVDVWLSDGHQGPLDVSAPVVAHFHEAAWADPDLRPLMDPAFVAHYEASSAAAARSATRLLTISRSSQAQIQEAYGLPADRIHLAPLGVDHDVYHPGLPPPDDLLARAGGDARNPYVLFVSTVHPRKNLAVLRDALALLASDGLTPSLVLVAGPAADRPDSADLERRAVAPIPGSTHPPVNFAGASDHDVARLMAGATTFCLPSLMEGFGMAVAEAMACGAPPVVSDRGSLPEVVGDAGIVTSVDAHGVAAGLRAVLTSTERREALAAAAVRRAAGYTWSGMADRWYEAILAAADERRCTAQLDGFTTSRPVKSMRWSSRWRSWVAT